MPKKQKLLIIISLIAFFLVLYLVLTSESAKFTKDSGSRDKDKIAASFESDYKTQTAELFASYENSIRSGGLTEGSVAELKNKLLALKLPAKFKELHIQFVLALTKMENYFSSKDEQEKNYSLEAVNRLKADYSWLNR